MLGNTHSVQLGNAPVTTTACNTRTDWLCHYCNSDVHVFEYVHVFVSVILNSSSNKLDEKKWSVLENCLCNAEDVYASLCVREIW